MIARMTPSNGATLNSPTPARNVAPITCQVLRSAAGTGLNPVSRIQATIASESARNPMAPTAIGNCNDTCANITDATMPIAPPTCPQLGGSQEQAPGSLNAD